MLVMDNNKSKTIGKDSPTYFNLIIFSYFCAKSIEVHNFNQN